MPEFYHTSSPIPKAPGKCHIFIATPTLNTYPNHFASIVRALPRLMNAGIAVDHYILANGCHIDDLRNNCVHAFLKSDADYLVFIDADVGFPPEALYRLAMHEGDIVAGVYPRKEMQRSYPFRFEGDVLKAEDDGLIREGILSVPAGFLRLSRKLLEHMAEHFIERGFKSPEVGGEFVPCLFERRTIHGERHSGDVAFCVAARELGYPIYVDPMLPFSHAGEFRFQGMLAADFAEPANQDEKVN